MIFQGFVREFCRRSGPEGHCRSSKVGRRDLGKVWFPARSAPVYPVYIRAPALPITADVAPATVINSPQGPGDMSTISHPGQLTENIAQLAACKELLLF